MQRRQFTVATLAPIGLMLGAPAVWALTETEASTGVRAVLERAAGVAVSQLGRSDGFLGDARVRIGLPPALERAGDVMRRLGQGRRVDELVTGMNRAAEQAVPLARPMLLNAVRSMSVEDALQLVRGGNDTAISDFFSRKTREPLTTAFSPEVLKVTERLSLARRHDELVDRAAKTGLVRPGETKRVHEYVTDKSLDGLFMVLADEERKLRADPVAAGSAVLKRLFGR